MKDSKKNNNEFDKVKYITKTDIIQIIVHFSITLLTVLAFYFITMFVRPDENTAFTIAITMFAIMLAIQIVVGIAFYAKKFDKSFGGVVFGWINKSKEKSRKVEKRSENSKKADDKFNKNQELRDTPYNAGGMFEQIQQLKQELEKEKQEFKKEKQAYDEKRRKFEERVKKHEGRKQRFEEIQEKTKMYLNEHTKQYEENVEDYKKHHKKISGMLNGSYLAIAVFIVLFLLLIILQLTVYKNFLIHKKITSILVITF